jgi:GntR family transcriptional regulator
MKSLLSDGDVPDRPMVHIAMGKLVPDDLLGTRFRTRIRVEELEYGVVNTTPNISMLLRIQDPTVLMVEQVAVLDDHPLYLRVGYYPAATDPHALADRIRDADTRLVQPVEATFASLFGAPYGHAAAVLEAVRCEERAAELLDITEGDTVLLRQMVLVDAYGRPRSLSYTHFRSDRVALTTTS